MICDGCGQCGGRYDSDAKGSGSGGEGEGSESEEERVKEKSRKRKKESSSKASKPAKRMKEVNPACRTGTDMYQLWCMHMQDTGRKKKANKDPNAPKKPLSAYMLWLQENRPMIKQKYPGSTLGEVGKRAGEMWKALSDKTVRFASGKEA